MEPILEFEGVEETIDGKQFDPVELMAQPFSSPGGKMQIAAKIVAKIPEHKVYVEAYAGGAAVFFKMEKKEGVKEVLNDLNTNIANCYLFMKQATPEQLEEAGRLCHMLGKKEFYDLKAKLAKTPIAATPQGFADFYNLNRSSFASARDSYGYIPKNIKMRIGRRLPELHERMKNVEICNDDAVKVIREYDSPDTFFYLDPPYPKTWRSSHGYTYENVEELAKTLSTLKGKFFLNLGRDPKVYAPLKKYKLKTSSMSTRRTANNRKDHGRGIYTETEHIAYNYELSEADAAFILGDGPTAELKQNKFSLGEAQAIGEKAGIDWKTAKFPLTEFHMGLDVELEHGTRNKETNITNDDDVLTAKIAWVHLLEMPDYYTKLREMERGGDAGDLSEAPHEEPCKKEALVEGKPEKKAVYSDLKELLQNLVSGAPYAVLEGRKGTPVTLTKVSNVVRLEQKGKDISKDYENIIRNASKVSKKDYVLSGKILLNKSFLTQDVHAYDGQMTDKHEFYERRKVGEQLQYNETIRKAKCLVLTAKNAEQVINSMAACGEATIHRADSTLSSTSENMTLTYERNILTKDMQEKINKIAGSGATKVTLEQLQTIATMTLDSDHLYYRSDIARESGTTKGTVYNQQKAMGLI